MEFTNKYTAPPAPTASLKIKKFITGDPSEKTSFQFKVVDDDDNEKGNFSLSNGGEKTIPGLPLGKYTITETELPIDNWEATVKVDGEVKALTDGKSITVDLVTEGKEVVVEFTNTYAEPEPDTATLKIKKLVAKGVDTDTPFEFKITGPYFGTSEHTFTLKHGQTETFSELTLGTYTVTETVPTNWKVAVSGGDNANPCHINLAENANKTITFTNTKCYKILEKQHILIQGSKLQSTVEDNPEGVLATMTLSQPSGRKGYFTVTLESQSGLKGWCLTKDYTISNGTHDVILFPISAYTPYKPDVSMARICGIIDGRGSYGWETVQNAIWKETDNIHLDTWSNAYKLWNNATPSTSSCGIVAIPVENLCKGGRSIMLSRDLGDIVDKNIPLE